MGAQPRLNGDISSVEGTLRVILTAARTMNMRVSRGACGGCALFHARSWYEVPEDVGLTDFAVAHLGMTHAQAWAFMSGFDEPGGWMPMWFDRPYGHNFNESHRAWWDLGHRLAAEFCPES